MNQPIIFVIDDDQQVLRAMSRDLKKAYRKQYRILSTISAKEALDVTADLKKRGETVALFLSDQRMPEMQGVEFLEKAKSFYPDAKRMLLTAYSDTNAAIQAINEVQLDYYLLKPWDPPEERLYPILNDQLDEWEQSFVPDFKGIRVIGYQYSPQSHQIKDFLAGNLIPYQWLDVENSEKANELIAIHQLNGNDLPVVIFEDGSVLRSPDLPELGNKMGMQTRASENYYDVTIIGGGPAGLAAAVYGGSEGLKTLLIERKAPGGQAGTSSRIENYLGFPKGLSGADLTRRAVTQATRFGVEFLTPVSVEKISIKDEYKILTLSDGSKVNSRSIIITTGVDYRKLNAKGLDSFTGAGVYYGAASTEAQSCKDKAVYIVGGGNSAGQAAMYLSNFAKEVNIVIRKPDLKSSMSSYLIEQIKNTDNIMIRSESEVVEAGGSNKLEWILLKNNSSGETAKKETNNLLIFIGAKPVTEWVDLDIIRNTKGFLETGRDLINYEAFQKFWKKDRDPFLLETSIPGIFAAGDVRAGAMNRVASAVGEGAMAIKLVHEYLSESA